MPAYKDEKTGKWYCQFYCKDWTGKNKHIVKRGFDKKKDALDYERKFKNAAKHQDVYFEELIEEYIKKMQHKVRATTLERINTVINTHFLPFFAGLPLSQITPAVINKWQHFMQSEQKNKKGDPLAPSTLLIINSRLGSLFTFACRIYGLKENPVKGLDCIGSLKARRKMNILTPEQFSLLVDTFHRESEKTLLKTLFWSGCRIGEALALTQQDIILDSNDGRPALRFNKTVVTVNRKLAIHPPKTLISNRVTPIPYFLYQDLITYTNKLYRLKPGDRIFQYVSRNSIGGKVKRRTEKLGMPIIRIHDLRHSYVSLMLSLTKDVAVVAECIGDNIDTTLSTYTHLLPNQKKNAVAMLEDLGTSKVHTVDTVVL